MPTQLEQISKTTADLLANVRAGAVFQSLGADLGHIVERITEEPVTPLGLTSSDDTAISERIDELQHRAHQGQLHQMTDDDLLFLLKQLSSKNPDIRDHGVYAFMINFASTGIFSDGQLQMAYRYLTQDNVLFDHILEPENDGIYGRAFAVLILDVLMFIDSESQPFMTPEMRQDMLYKISLYTLLERDTRGFIGSYGWAHAFTHIGNLMSLIAGSNSMQRADKLFALQALLARYQRLDTPLNFGEPERLADSLETFSTRHTLYDDAIVSAFNAWPDQPLKMTEAGMTRYYNRSHLLNALLLSDDAGPELKEYLHTAPRFLG